jgi:hypothetical protein
MGSESISTLLAPPDESSYAASNNREPTMNRWEYEVVQVHVAGGNWSVGGQANPAEIKNALNQLGMQGWELASAFDTTQGGGASRQIVLLFKRMA